MREIADVPVEEFIPQTRPKLEVLGMIGQPQFLKGPGHGASLNPGLC